jgi:isoquinoline 1-oxidoreductase beta subunit
MAGAVRGGKVVAWSNRIVGQSLRNGTAVQQAGQLDKSLYEGAEALPYDIPDFRCEVHAPVSPVTVSWWRSVGHSHTAYAVECFIDQLLIAAGLDPVEGRLAMMGSSPRAAGVLRAAAAAAGWPGKPIKGRGRGVAVVESFRSYVAQVAEVSIGESGEPKVHKIWCAVDCGVAVNPDVIRAQMEGGIGFGLGHALYAEVPLAAGRPMVSNFDDYRSLRIMEMPEIEVVIVQSGESPTGVGEPGVPPIAPAIANALAALGRERPSQLPMVKRG